MWHDSAYQKAQQESERNAMAKANRVYPQKAPVTKNQEVEGEVVDITYQGMGVVKIDNFPIHKLSYHLK